MLFTLSTVGMFLLAVGIAEAQQTPRDAVELYFRAHASGNGDFIRQAFTPDARIEFVEKGEFKQWTREEFASKFLAPASDEHRRVRRLEHLEITGTSASATLTLDYPQVLFADHLSLLKIGDQWKVVNKVFSADHRNAGREAIQDTLQNRSLPFEPQRIIGNVYYVGSNLISSFLIVTSDGLVLLDTGHSGMLPQVEANIEKLGFQPKDVKFLLNSHAHFDHCGGFAQFKRETGATIVASKLDGELMKRGGKGDFQWGDDLAYEPVTPNRYVSDGERLELGGVTLTAHMTPGHTMGCTSWSMRTNENGKNYDVLFLCGLTVSTYKLTNNDHYPNIVEDVRRSLAKLRGMHVDVLLASHGFWFDLEGKAARHKEGAPNPFIDPQELDRHLTEMKADFEQALRSQERQR